MISYFEASLSQLSVHKVGNKAADETLTLSEHPIEVKDEMLDLLLKQYFLLPFEKIIEVYRLTHATRELGLNEVYHFCDQIFNEPEQFHESSKQLAKHLFDISNHPKIKAGEVYITFFQKLQIEGELHDAVGIFKSESKEPFLTISLQDKQFDIRYEQEAINIKKLDKGCIIFNTEKEEGYKVAVVDQTNKSEAVYWMDEFLKVKIRNDNYNQTNATLTIYKSFVTEKMEEEFDLSKTDKIDLLNRSISYFKKRKLLILKNSQTRLFLIHRE
jgi:hypothetical protein